MLKKLFKLRDIRGKLENESGRRKQVTIKIIQKKKKIDFIENFINLI